MTKIINLSDICPTDVMKTYKKSLQVIDLQAFM